MAKERAVLRKPAAAERRPAAVAARAASRPAPSHAMPPSRTLQQRLGNQGTQALAARAVARAAAPGMTSAGVGATGQLSVSQPGDTLEVEADRVADAVMAAPAPPVNIATSPENASRATIHRACAACADESGHGSSSEAESITRSPLIAHRKEAATPEVTPAVEAKVRTLQNEGSPLPPATREFFEARFGADFSQVRVNTGGRADQTAKSLGARAFTVGRSITFGAGQYAPESQEGRRLLAHELTHVVQQDEGVRRAPSVQRQTVLPREPDTASPAGLGITSTSGTPQLQAAWYNFDIPFTDYQFDPSVEGIKTAAGVVKDAAVEALDWVVDQIKELVNSGIAWLSEQWASIKAFAGSAWEGAKRAFGNIVGFIRNPLGFLADAIMSFDAQAVARAWATFSKLVSMAADGFKALTGTLLQQVNRLWNGINGFATSLLNKLAGLTQNFVFKKLPDALQKVAFGVIDTLKRLWKTINDGFTALLNKIKAWVEAAIDAVFGFVRKVLSFGINVVIAGIIAFGKIVLFLKDFFANPQKYLAILAQRTAQAFAGVETRFAGIVGQYFGGGKAAATPSAAPPLKVQREPETPAAAPETKRTATWSEIGDGVLKMMGDKWQEFKSNPLQLVLTLLLDLCLPIIGNVKDIIQLFKDIKKAVSAPLSAGSLQELWTSLLLLLEIPRLIAHAVVGILMRTLTLPLIVASFIPEPIVQTVATVVGYALLGAFVQLEAINLAHKLLLLKTGLTVKSQRDDACNSIADSLIALIMAAVMFLVVLLLKFIASVARGIINIIKGKIVTPEIKPVETKGPGAGEGKGESKGGGHEEGKPKTEDPSAKDLGTQNGKKVLSEKGTADGKHEVKVTEEGIRCCSDLCEIMIKDIDAHVAENPTLKEKLAPMRKQLETAQGKLESARIAEERAAPEAKADAARDVKAAADEAAEVGAKLKPQIDQIVKDAPLPSGLRFNEYSSPENAMGMTEGRAKPAGWDPVTKPESILEGYTRREYYIDNKGQKWSLDTRPVEGGKAYRLVHESGRTR
jgi:hypothetical protein